MKRTALFFAGLFAAHLLFVSSPAEARHWESKQHRSSWQTQDPVQLRLSNTRTFTLNNYYDGFRYQSSGQNFGRRDVKVLKKNWDGTYNIWFAGRVYRAEVKNYKGTLCLYLGHAPTGPGYLYELLVR